MISYSYLFILIVDPPKIIQHPRSMSVATGADITMSVRATGDNLRYQWKKNGIDLSDDDRHHGTGTDTLHIVKVEKMGDNKARYRCSVRSEIGEEFSDEAVLTVSKLMIVVVCVLLAIVIGASLSKPHTSGTALHSCVCVCLDQPLTINCKKALAFTKTECPG